MPRIDINALEAIARNETEQRDEERVLDAIKELVALREEVEASRAWTGSLIDKHWTRLHQARRATDEVWR